MGSINDETVTFKTYLAAKDDLATNPQFNDMTPQAVARAQVSIGQVEVQVEVKKATGDTKILLCEETKELAKDEVNPNANI